MRRWKYRDPVKYLIRMDSDQKKECEDMAELNGMCLSDWINSVLKNQIKKGKVKKCIRNE